MTPPAVDADALLCALILAPRTFSRNRHFDLFEGATLARVRRRASRVRGIVRQLSQPGAGRAEVTGEQVLADGRVLLRFRVPTLALSRTTALSPLEAATLRYALHRAGLGPLTPRDRSLVEQACARLGLGVDGLWPRPPAPAR